jgi:hypothetical protein
LEQRERKNRGEDLTDETMRGLLFRMARCSTGCETGEESRAEQRQGGWRSSKTVPFDGPVAVAADDEHLGVVPLDGVAEHVPGVTLERLELGVGHLRGGAEVPGLVDDAQRGALEVGLHERQHVRRA